MTCRDVTIILVKLRHQELERLGTPGLPLSSSCHSIGRHEAMDDSTPSQSDSKPLDSRRPVKPEIKKHASSSPTFGKTAIVILVIAVVAYMYQVCN